MSLIDVPHTQKQQEQNSLVLTSACNPLLKDFNVFGATQ